MARYRFLAAFLLVGALFCEVAFAAPATVDEAVAAGRAASGASDLSSSIAPTHSGGAFTTGTALPAPLGDVGMQDPTTRQKYLHALGRYYDYRNDGYAFRSRVFEWQLLSTRVIFVIVVLLVLSGIYFAAMQFHVALATARRQLPRKEAPRKEAPRKDSRPGEIVGSSDSADSPAAEAGMSLATQLEISAKGVIVNSSVLGVVILTLSLAFFYLYLVYVYPINDTL